MAQDIETILREIGPSLSSKIVAHLLNEGVSQDAARKRISRIRGNVRRLTGVQFPNREVFLFLDGQYGTPEFRSSLVNSFISSGSSFGKALRGLMSRDGVMRLEEFPIASGLPTRNAKGHPLHVNVEAKLFDLKLISKEVTPDGEFAVLYAGAVSLQRNRGVRIVEDLVLNALQVWMMKTGWTSPNVVKLRTAGSDLPLYGQYAWAFTCPTYLAGIVSYSAGTVSPGFVVGDILLNRTVTLEDLIPFFSKCDALTAQHRVARLQPWFIAEFFQADALHALRSRGVVVGIPASLFGEDVGRDLKSLIDILENAAAAVAKDPQGVLALMSRLSKIEGTTLNLRGVVIEMIVAHLYKLNGYSIDIRQIAHNDIGQMAEIDVYAKNRQHVICCECKGKSPGNLVSDKEITDWLERSLPRIKEWLKRAPNNPDSIFFEFFSSTGYTKEAQDLIDTTVARHKKQPIKFYGGDEIIRRLKDQNENALVDVYREQFQQK